MISPILAVHHNTLAQAIVCAEQLAMAAVPNTRTVNGHPLSADVTVTKSDVVLGSVDNVQQMPLSYLDTDVNLTANSDTKTPSQKAIKSYVDTGLGTKQNSLGFTAENSANKDTDVALAANSDTKYPSQKAIKSYVDTGLGTKQNSLGFTAENSANKNAASGYAGLDSGSKLAAAQLPNPSATTLGGTESLAAVAHKWINTISTSGVPSATQPAESDLSFTDITTNNATSSLHGFLPKLSGAQSDALRGDGTFVALPSGISAGNPTASVGLAIVNGSLTTFMRSDAAPPLDQTIAPTWTGLHTFKYSDAGTNTFTDVVTLGHNSSGTPATSFGGSLLFNLKSSTTSDRNAARLGALWTTATDASRTSAFDVQLVNNAGSLAGVARFFASGGFSVNSTTDPGAGIINANTGYQVGGVAASGNVLRGNGTNFVSSTLAFADLASKPTTLSGYGITDSTNAGTTIALYNVLNTLQTSSKAVQGSASLSSGSATVNFTGGFTSNATFQCYGTDATNAGAVAVKINENSGTQILITGTGSDIVHFICIGN